ncbi:TadE/TadG family type IV pilus assembly protein [Rhodoferax sp.]|uniref:TadE/TadG family type IV pilus assembly protein n=1 Tax=Rhodoferax sp. TaxID=50421 RepID=UPI0025E442F9|nr:TadE/TadG family type IV pilus assembly protein [Rhodoferax sp.]MCM2342921.1 Tad domain-containing protein [Rhodoferax sp.]
MKTVRLKAMRSQCQRGAVAITFGLTLVVLIGFVGLAIDLGRFFVIKTELQNGMDACALSAASQLRPGANDTNALIRAVAYGNVFSQGAPSDPSVRNLVNFQSQGLEPSVLTITFATSNAGPYNVTDPNTAKFVKCEYPLAGLPIYFMQVLNPLLTTQTVNAWAVAKRETPAAACIPVAVCTDAGGNAGNNFNHNVGDWLTAFDGTQYGTGNFGWIDFTPPFGGASEIKNILAGSMQCNISQTGDQVGQTGKQDTLQEAWNTRFGWYRKGGGYSPLEAPPDKTGFAYSNLNEDGTANGGNWPSGFNAYSGTSTVSGQPKFGGIGGAQEIFKPYQETIPVGIKTNQYSQPLQEAQLEQLGRTNRRIVAAPVVNCSVWNTPPGSQMPPILGWACVLMLNPMESGSAASDIAKLEFLGLSSAANSPCSGGEENANAPVLTQ